MADHRGLTGAPLSLGCIRYWFCHFLEAPFYLSAPIFLGFASL